MKPDSLWRNRDFTLLWTGQALSGLGTSMSSLAFPLITLATTGSSVLAGVVGTVEMAIGLLAGLPAGVLVDTVDRRRLMIACDAVRLVAYTVFTGAVLGGHVSYALIMALAMVEGLCGSAFSTAAMTVVPRLVATDQLADAMATNEARNYAVQVAGRPLGGLAFGLSRTLPFLGDAVSYLCSVVSLLLIRTPLQLERTTPPEHPIRSLAGGLRFIARTPAIRAVVLIGGPLNFAVNGAMFGIVLVLRNHGVQPALIGLSQTALAVGGVLGAIAAPYLRRRFSPVFLIRAITGLGIPLLIATAPLGRWPVAAVPVGAIVLLSPPLNAVLFAYLAAITPDHRQGRVMSALFTTVMGLAALAPAAAGTLVHIGGMTALVAGVVVAQGVATLSAFTSTGIRELGRQYVCA